MKIKVEIDTFGCFNCPFCNNIYSSYDKSYCNLSERHDRYVEEYAYAHFNTIEEVFEKEPVCPDWCPLLDKKIKEEKKCKNCKHYFDYSVGEKPFCKMFLTGYDTAYVPEPDDYCSRWEGVDCKQLKT